MQNSTGPASAPDRTQRQSQPPVARIHCPNSGLEIVYGYIENLVGRKSFDNFSPILPSRRRQIDDQGMVIRSTFADPQPR